MSSSAENSASPLLEIVAQFLSRVVIEKGQSELTARTYGRHLRHFMRFLDGIGRRSWDKVNHEDITAWLMEQKDRGFHPNSLYLAVATLRAFFKYARAEGLCDDLTSVLDLPHRREGLPHALSSTEVGRLLKAAPF